MRSLFSHESSAQSRTAGWTLVELMMVLAIMGVLAAIAWPSYTTYVQRGHRAEAAAALMDAQNYMERYYTAYGRYSLTGSTAGAGGALTAPSLPARLQNIPSGNGNGVIAARYSLSVSQVSTNSYTLSAVPTGGMAGDKCGSLTLTHTMVRGVTSTAASVAECWR